MDERRADDLLSMQVLQDVLLVVHRMRLVRAPRPAPAALPAASCARAPLTTAARWPRVQGTADEQSDVVAMMDDLPSLLPHALQVTGVTCREVADASANQT